MSFIFPFVTYEFKIIEGSSFTNPTVTATIADGKVKDLVKDGWEPISIGGAGVLLEGLEAKGGSQVIHTVYVLLRRPKSLFKKPP